MTGASPTGTKGVPRARREAQILDVAVEEFGREGFARASMAAIAAAAGVSKPLLYQYFGSKDGLFGAALSRTADELLSGITATMAAATQLPSQPIAVVRAVFATLEPRRSVWSLVFDPSVPVSGDVARTVRLYREQVSELAVLGSRQFLLERGNDDPLDASALADVWMSAVSSLIDWWIAHPAQSAADMTSRAERLLSALTGPARAEPATQRRRDLQIHDKP